ncbi:MAG: Fe-S cluster assembly protein SufD [Candidatus Eremiobacteraeota bacterium]|nr:Fe-S cluster assembly protein SufD [Candidatus Eremiobacteraeota bacterium]
MASASTTADVFQGNGRVPTRALFEAFLEELDGSRQATPVISSEIRSEAFKGFERLDASGGKPGRDWKHDYTRIGTDIPLLQRSTVKHNAHAADGVRFHTPDTEGGAEFVRTYLGRAVHWREDKFASLALAFLEKAIVIAVPAAVRVEQPIDVKYDASEATGSSFPYTLVVLEPGAEATVVENAFGGGAFSCGIVEAIVGDGARLNYIVVQRADAQSTVLMNRGAVCGQDASCHWYLAELGGALSRSVVSTRLEGRGASSEITAFFFNDGDQHVDLASLVEHAVGDSTSRTTIKSAAKDRGQGRYLGNIRIAENANGSDAALRDDALLLSKTAHIDSVPALEIASNDVKAFHGATVGSIDEEELFYAQSRGIERTEAERMIALGFFEPALSVFPIEPVRDLLRMQLTEKARPAAPTANG